VTDYQDASDSEIQLTGTDTINTPFSATMQITNFAAANKNVTWSASEVEAAGTNSDRYSGVGAWYNTADQITSVTAAMGANNFNAGTHLWCEGRDVADYAENYYTTDPTMDAADVVVGDSSLTAGIKKASVPYDSQLIGVISTKPAITLDDYSGVGQGWAKPVALAGRIPVKVSTINGPISTGDSLTSSTIPGVAMKATKAGAIIGQALESYDGEAVGKVMMFVKPSVSMGNTPDIEGLDFAGIQPLSAIDRSTLLEEFITSNSYAQFDPSVLYTDRVFATQEIIAPVVTADTIQTDSIISDVPNGVKIRFAPDGSLLFESSSSATPILSISTQGNVVIHGALFADAIQIATESGSLQASPSTEIAGSANTQSIIWEGITALLPQLKIMQTLQVLGSSIFSGPVEFLSKVMFNGKVTFDTDTAGSALLPKWTTSVDVAFETPYETPPVVSVTMLRNEATDSAFLALPVAVSNVTERGFTIVTDLPSPRDQEFNWIALAVKNKRRTIGKQIALPDGEGELLGTTSASPSATPVPTVIPTIVLTPIPTVGDTPLPTSIPTQTVSPTPTPTSEQQTVSVLENEIGFVRIRSSYSSESEDLGTIPVGTRVPYSDEQYGWYNVSYNGISGWVSGTYVAKE